VIEKKQLNWSGSSVQHHESNLYLIRRKESQKLYAILLTISEALGETASHPIFSPRPPAGPPVAGLIMPKPKPDRGNRVT